MNSQKIFSELRLKFWFYLHTHIYRMISKEFNYIENSVQNIFFKSNFEFRGRKKIKKFKMTRSL